MMVVGSTVQGLLIKDPIFQFQHARVYMDLGMNMGGIRTQKVDVNI